MTTNQNSPKGRDTSSPAVLEVVELGFQWQGLDPFIFTMHHLDEYPEGDENQGPGGSLAGRRIGSDFSGIDGWSMYHGAIVPGFPQHPHRGFETVTVVRRGYVDHSDSLGATARYGGGDVQWLTTGSGIQHAEMFPLIRDDADNPLELFQIWLNLPPQSKMVPAYFRMLWSEEIPTIEPTPGVSVDVIAGELGGHRAPHAPPDSWASNPLGDMAIWLIRVDGGATWELPPHAEGLNRMLHFFDGEGAVVDGMQISSGSGIRLRSDLPASVTALDGPAEFLLLQGRPIGAPVFQMGPFVMNTPEELQQAFDDYRRTGFGGWPWASPDPVHARTDGRFALHADGTVEHREMQPAP
ncbi:MAG: pirin family protein [Acidimicrobiia bacterium]|nr:pirin family protein [Acidimicrobiia bacterium]